MGNIYEQRMCKYCKNENCNSGIVITVDNNFISYKCNNYQKDSSKITPYQKPLLVTAKRDYILDKEI